jgi:hypothetical protein
MRHKLRLLSLVLIAVFIFSFTGCRTATNTTAVETTNAAEITQPETTTETTEPVNTIPETTVSEISNEFDIAGMWKDEDGTTRIFSSDGTCQNVVKIDIGGPSPVYTISEKKDNNGYYLLFVSQSGYNQTTFYVKIISSDEIQIYENPSAKEALYKLTRM